MDIRIAGKSEWQRIDVDRDESIEAALERHLTAIDKPITRFVERVFEVRLSESADITRYFVLLDWNVGYEIKKDV